MIQRIQTVYLLLVVICLSLVFVFPFASYIVVSETYVFDVMGMNINGENLTKFPFYVAAVLSVLISLFTIFSYKNRKKQLKIGRINYLVILTIIVLSFVNVRTNRTIFEDVEVLVSYKVGLFLPVAALAFLFLANRSIKKDEDLIKSLDRLR